MFCQNDFTFAAQFVFINNEVAFVGAVQFALPVIDIVTDMDSIIRLFPGSLKFLIGYYACPGAVIVDRNRQIAVKVLGLGRIGGPGSIEVFRRCFDDYNVSGLSCALLDGRALFSCSLIRTLI